MRSQAIHQFLALLLICSSFGCGRVTEQRSAATTGPVISDPAGAWSAVAVGDAHSCGLTKVGVAYCWGWNDRNELGDGTFFARNVPTLVSSSLRFVSFCWSTIDSDPDGPGALPGKLRFRALSSATVRFCGATVDGKAYCWADAVAWSQSIAQLQPVASTTRVVAVAGGDMSDTLNKSFHGCAVGADSAAVCWGTNSYGQLGDGTYENRASSITVRGGLKLANIYALFGRSCAVSAAGEAYCWGVPIQCVPASTVSNAPQPPCTFPDGLATPTRPIPTVSLRDFVSPASPLALIIAAS